MNRAQIFHFFSGFILVAALVVGYLLGDSGREWQIDRVFFLLHSERDGSTVMNIKVMEALREGKQDEALRVLEISVASQLKYEGVRAETLERAKGYC